jgi:hypothetical protein
MAYREDRGSNGTRQVFGGEIEENAKMMEKHVTKRDFVSTASGSAPSPKLNNSRITSQ